MCGRMHLSVYVGVSVCGSMYVYVSVYRVVMHIYMRVGLVHINICIHSFELCGLMTLASLSLSRVAVCCGCCGCCGCRGAEGVGI